MLCSSLVIISIPPKMVVGFLLQSFEALEFFHSLSAYWLEIIDLTSRGGIWFGDHQTPTVLSKAGKNKIATGEPLNRLDYGRKESEGRDFNEDTNFGKLKRIPYKPLQEFLARNGAHFSARGNYPSPWVTSGYEGIATAGDDADD